MSEEFDAPKDGTEPLSTMSKKRKEITPAAAENDAAAANVLKALVHEEEKKKDCLTIQPRPPIPAQNATGDNTKEEMLYKFHDERKEFAGHLFDKPTILCDDAQYEKALSLFKEDHTTKLIKQIRDLVDPTFASTDGVDQEDVTRVEHISDPKIAKLSQLLEDIAGMKSPKDLGDDYYEDYYERMETDMWKRFAAKDVRKDRDKAAQLLQKDRDTAAQLLQQKRCRNLEKAVAASSEKHNFVLTQLHNLRNLSQAEISMNTEAAHAALEKKQKMEDQLEAAQAGEKTLAVTDQNKKLLQEQNQFAQDSHFEDGKIVNSRKGSRYLMLLSSVFNLALEQAAFLERYDATSAKVEGSDAQKVEGSDAQNLQPKSLDEYKTHIQDTIKFLERTFEKCHQKLQEWPTNNQSIQAKHEFIRDIVKQEIGQDKKPLYFPGPRVQEVEGVQPIFEWLLGKVSFCLLQEDGPIHHRVSEKSPPMSTAINSLKNTPRKDKNGREAAVVSNNREESTRYGDFTCVKDGRHICVYRDDYMPFIIEVKPLWRTEGNWRHMVDSGMQQVLAHTSKYVYMGAIAGGVGANAHASGAIATLAYIQVVRLKLQKMETGEPELVLERTKMLPLMTKKNFREYCKANLRAMSKPEEGLEAQLYGDAEASSEIEPGFLSLGQIVTAPSSELFGHPLASYAFENGDETTLGSVLGFGTFANVYSICKNGKACDRVAKISRFGRKQSLESEANVLKVLGTEANNSKKGSEYLYKLVWESDVLLNVRGYARSYLQIITSPKCDRGALEHIHRAQTQEEKTNRAWDIFQQIRQALNFLHECGFVHNDVSSRNIMVKGDTAILIDLSIATKIGEATYKLQGNLQTMHRACHGGCPNTGRNTGNKWYPDGCHDDVSLAYTVVIMWVGSVPWPKLQAGFSKNGPEVFEKRQEEAKKVVKSLLLTETQKEDLKGLIDMDACSCYACSCKKGCTQHRCSCRKRRKDKCSRACGCNCEGGSLPETS